MSKVRGLGPAPNREISETFADFLNGAAKLLLWLGLGLTVIGVGFLLYTCNLFSGPSAPDKVDQALANIGIFDKFLLAGLLALAASSTYLFWGESVLGALQLIFAALLYFSPLLLSMAGMARTDSRPVSEALASLTKGGMLFGGIAIVVLVIDITVRQRDRLRQGAKLEQLKYGKGIKEEVDRKNVLLGKCWQLPFCRKFVRERCPIYHAKRTCWRELTGCMCEEQVIRNAMENKTIPKDALMAASYIPRNMKLTVEQKRERCRSCVIFNEHQKHKYKVALPTVLITCIAIYVLAHGPLLDAVGGLIKGLDSVIGKATLQGGGQVKNGVIGGQPFQELLLACLTIITLAYLVKVVEYLVFKRKV